MLLTVLLLTVLLLTVLLLSALLLAVLFLSTLLLAVLFLSTLLLARVGSLLAGRFVALFVALLTRLLVCLRAVLVRIGSIGLSEHVCKFLRGLTDLFRSVGDITIGLRAFLGGFRGFLQGVAGIFSGLRGGLFDGVSSFGELFGQFRLSQSFFMACCPSQLLGGIVDLRLDFVLFLSQLFSHGFGNSQLFFADHALVELAQRVLDFTEFILGLLGQSGCQFRCWVRLVQGGEILAPCTLLTFPGRLLALFSEGLGITSGLLSRCCIFNLFLRLLDVLFQLICVAFFTAKLLLQSAFGIFRITLLVSGIIGPSISFTFGRGPLLTLSCCVTNLLGSCIACRCFELLFTACPACIILVDFLLYCLLGWGFCFCDGLLCVFDCISH